MGLYDIPVTFEPSARREFGKLTAKVKNRLREHINRLAINPCPSGVKKLKGKHQYYRNRVGDYRIMYRIRDNVFKSVNSQGCTPERSVLTAPHK